MNFSVLLALLLLISTVATAAASASAAASAANPPRSAKARSQEYCSSETLSISCPPQHSILIESARFGRMQAGRCISSEYKHTMSCYADVRSHIDSRCSGRQSCQVVVGSLDSIAQPCNKDFKSYLEAQYACVPVLHHVDETCSQPYRIPATSGYIGRLSLSSVARMADSGAISRCRWSLRAERGRRLVFTLFAFRSSSEENSADEESGGAISAGDSGATSCGWSAILSDGKRQGDVKICSGDQRERRVFASESNSVDVYFRSNGERRPPPYFLLQYQVEGCADVEAPSGGWLVRSADNLEMKCNETSETWYLTCRGGHWIGQLGNCTTLDGAANIVAGSQGGRSRILQEAGLIFAIIIGIILGLIIGLSLLGVVYVFRKRRRQTLHRGPELPSVEGRADARFPALLRQEKQLGGNVCEYTHVWEVAPARALQAGHKPQCAAMCDKHCCSRQQQLYFELSSKSEETVT